MTYDSRPETIAHSRRVDELLLQVIAGIQERVTKHDLSKTEPPEVEIFDEYTPKLKHTTYGSKEYKDCLTAMAEGLAHHYANNRHHPEHFGDSGISGMTLVDLVEMLCDWKAATERHEDGDLTRSLRINAERFSISHDLSAVLHNTAREAGWL